MKTSTSIFVIITILLSIVTTILIGVVLYLLLGRKRKVILEKTKNEIKKLKMQSIAELKFEMEKLKDATDKEIEVKREQLSKDELILDEKKAKYYKSLEELHAREDKINDQEANNKLLKKQLMKEIDEVNDTLSEVAKLSQQEAKEKMFEIVEKRYVNELGKLLKDREDKMRVVADNVAADILINAMERSHVQITNERNTTLFKLDDDKLKGKIIGREGRNLRTFQQFGGIDIVIDETPNSVLISSFNPIRRLIAFRTLESLIRTGKLNQVSIEETLLYEEEKLEQTFKTEGYEIIKDLDIYDFPEEVILNIAKLKYRYSYGQNVLQHSIEVAKLSKNIAEEFNLDTDLALRAGLLHDIGKALDFEQEGTHVTLGVELLRKYRFNDIIVNSVESHHEDVEKKSIYAHIVSIADAVSAARRGARSNGADIYFARMKEIEDECNKFEGVIKTYAIQSGRQIRILINPEVIDDYQMKNLLKEITERVKQINKTPGEVNITLIRESRETAKI
ncbi:ribonucrease Y [Spiroplasma chinense]|uniref:Ribonuclease Y n=1 Tax=Spiroplasma chinense TaxID=216932 RepID=A0A5B9Y497_9MOLU|nr:Rnase Y domain-containing protein [Spiroplasma chinense]QEH61625.1 ribonucrease Y [Spiroplasma chinense]